MAIRLEKVFGSTADAWLRMQMQRDLWEARQRADTIKVNEKSGLFVSRKTTYLVAALAEQPDMSAVAQFPNRIQITFGGAP